MTERRTLEDGKAWLLDRLARRVHPVDGLDPITYLIVLLGAIGATSE